MSRVCFASYGGFDGCIQSCRSAADVLGGTWALIEPDVDTPAAVLDAEILVLSSWHERYEPIVAQRGPLVLARWHSTVLQVELGDEQRKLSRIVELLDRGRLAAVWASDPELVPVLGRQRVTFVPELLSDLEYEAVTPARLRGTHVSLFGAAHHRKNVLVQSAAFDRARRAAGEPAWTLHVNGHTLDDPGYERWLDIARVPYVDHGWMPRTEYLSLVAAMDAGLCATLAESYCYVAADHIALNVPVVASPTIACLGDEIRRTRPDRVSDVADALAAALSNRSQLAAAQRRSLLAVGRTNAAIARAALAAIADGARAEI